MLFEPSKWKIADSSKFAEFLASRRRTIIERETSTLVFRAKLSPYDVYKYLRARFGFPNGIQSMLRKPQDSDNLIHWDYVLLVDGEYLYFQGGNRDVHVTVYGVEMSSEDWARFAKVLKKDFSRVGAEIGKISENFEKWTVFANRFAMVADACANLHSSLVDEESPPDFTPKERTTEDGVKEYLEQLEYIGNRATLVYSASLSLDLITPILAESFINLVILLWKRDELRDNPRHLDAYLKQPIDSRVFDLHLKCQNFKSGVDSRREEFQKFHAVMQRRNYQLHGNFNPEKDYIETIYFEGYTPLFPVGGDPMLDLFRCKEKIFDVSGVLQRYVDVHLFFVYVLSLMEDKARNEFELIMADGEIGLDKKRKKLGRLFPPHESMLVVPQIYDDELNVDWS